MVGRSEMILWLRTWRIVEGLVNVLKHAGDSHIRWWAADTLGAIRDPMAVESLIEALGDEHSGVRRGAAWALGRMRDDRAVDPLTKVLEKDEDWRVRLAATLALGKIGDDCSISALEDAVSRSHVYVGGGRWEDDDRVAEAAQKSLDRIAEKSWESRNAEI